MSSPMQESVQELLDTASGVTRLCTTLALALTHRIVTSVSKFRDTFLRFEKDDSFYFSDAVFEIKESPLFPPFDVLYGRCHNSPLILRTTAFSLILRNSINMLRHTIFLLACLIGLGLSQCPPITLLPPAVRETCTVSLFIQQSRFHN